MKIFVENSALFYYEKSKVYSKETRKAGAYGHEKIHNRF